MQKPSSLTQPITPDTTESQISNLSSSKPQKRICLKSPISHSQLHTLISQKQPSLQQLFFYDCSLGQKGKGLEILLQIRLEKLKILFIQNDSINGKNLRQLAKHDWANLRIFSLKGNQLGVQDVKVVGKMCMKNLKNLFIGSNKINYEGGQALQLADWPHLQSLKLKDNQLCFWGCVYLCTGNWQNLLKLYIKGNNVKPSLRNQLVQVYSQNWDVEMI